MTNLVFWTGNRTIGGVDTWIANLKKHIDSESYKIVTIGDSGTFAGNRKIDINIYSWRQAEDVLLKLSPAVVVPNWKFPLFGICARLMEKGAALRTLGMCHSDSEKEYYEPLAWYESAISKFIAVGPLCRDKLIERIPFRKDDVFHLPYGINIPKVNRKIYSLKPLRIVYFGRLRQEQKRIFDLVKLAKILDENGVDFGLDIIGSGFDEAALKNMVSASGLAGQVRVLPQLPHSLVPEAIKDYDVFIQVSDYEGLGLSMIEAMAEKLIPVVTKASGGAWTIIENGKSGFCAEVGDIDKMALVLKNISLLRPEEAELIGANARTTAKEFFDIDVICPQFLDIAGLCLKDGKRKWAHGDILFEKRGLFPSYLPFNRFWGMLLMLIFKIVPRSSIRFLLYKIGLMK
ncbi:MAG: glycosyltransferase family 4 protein [Candidatus Omnitrophota bacterium]|jgi:glycosyltransferase involved in cell wall biosynthesis